MLSGAGVALRVITAPNSAFAQIRDNDGAYFVWSVCIFVITWFPMTIVLYMLYPNAPSLEDAFQQAGLGMLGGVAITALIYLVGRLLGGNGSWRKVFAVVFYTNVMVFPMVIAAAGLAPLGGGHPALESMGGGSPMLMPLSMAPFGGAGQPNSAGFGPWVGATLAPLIITLAVSVAILVWYVAVSVKAVKTVNGFGTARAFGLLVVAHVGYGAASWPLSM